MSSGAVACSNCGSPKLDDDKCAHAGVGACVALPKL